MQKKKTTAKRHHSKRRSVVEPGPARRTSKVNSKIPDVIPELGFIKRGDEITHVVLTTKEYDRLLSAELSLEAIKQIEDGDKEGDLVDADDLAVEFARDAIVVARKKAGLTQKALGKKLGLPQSQISRIERHPDRTTVRTLRKMARALNVNISTFLKGL